MNPPSIGRIVIYRQSGNERPVNGTTDHPAVITRVWSESVVNLHVMYDAAPPTPVTSVPQLGSGLAQPGERCWFWPERT